MRTIWSDDAFEENKETKEREFQEFLTYEMIRRTKMVRLAFTIALGIVLVPVILMILYSALLLIVAIFVNL